MNRTEGYMSPIEGFLDQVARKCCEYMRCGGGHLTQEREASTRRSGRPMTEAQKQRTHELAQAGKHTMPQIVREVGATYSSVNHFIHKHGYKVPVGSTNWRSMKKEAA